MTTPKRPVSRIRGPYFRKASAIEEELPHPTFPDHSLRLQTKLTVLLEAIRNVAPHSFANGANEWGCRPKRTCVSIKDFAPARSWRPVSGVR